MDNFLCCGTRYRAVRDALAQFLLEKKSDTFMAEIQVRETPELIGSPVTILDILLPSTCFPVFLCYISTVLFPPQKLRGSQISLLALAVFRQVTCRYKSPDGSIHPSPQVTIQDVWCGLCLFINVFPLFNILLYSILQEMEGLKELLKRIQSVEFRDFCSSLLLNQIGAPGSGLNVNMAKRQTLLELLVHLDSVLLSGNALLVPLYQIASQPQNVTVRHFLPTS